MKPLTRLGSRDRRAMVLGGSVLACTLLFRMAVQPYWHARAALVERLQEQGGLLTRELALVRSAAEVSNDLSLTSRHLDAIRPRLLEARDPLGAAADLVGAVGDEAHRHGVLVEAIESRTPVALGDHVTAVQVDVRGRGDLEGLLRWLYALESGGRLWRVEQLSLIRIDSPVAPDSADTETLAFAMSIRGFTMRSGTGQARVATASLGVSP